MRHAGNRNSWGAEPSAEKWSKAISRIFDDLRQQDRVTPRPPSQPGCYDYLVFFLARPSGEHLTAILDQSNGAAPSYLRVGATQAGELPPRFRHDKYEAHLGEGTGVWELAVEGLRRWAAHTGAGAEVFPADVRLAAGETLLVLLRAGPACVVAPCRVVYTIDEPSRFGFGYGTLPGHPEQGEEAFIVETDADRNVSFKVTAFSRPAETIAKLGAPAARLIQRRVTTRYLEALRRYVTT
jgi:uncharacterized protein (UPF0548 family)